MVPLGHIQATTTKILTHKLLNRPKKESILTIYLPVQSCVRPLVLKWVPSFLEKMQHVNQEEELSLSLFDFYF